MVIKLTTKTLCTAVLLSLATACTPNADEPIDAAEVTAPDTVADPVDPIDAGEPLAGPETEEWDSGDEGFADWDADADTMLDAQEFRAGVDDGDWFDDADMDDDAFLSAQEFAAIHAGVGDAPGGVDENGLFDIWDADEDGLIDNDEFAEGMYATWDQDQNELVDNNEYAAGNEWLGY